MPDQEDEIGLTDLEVDIVEGPRSVRIDERHTAKSDHEAPLRSIRIVLKRGLSDPPGAIPAAMDFDLTDEQKAIQSLCREFARDEVAPKAEAMDREARFPYEIVAKMAELGLMGLPFPEEYGGAGADTVCYSLAVLEFASRATTLML